MLVPFHKTQDTAAQRVFDAYGAANDERSRLQRRDAHRTIIAIVTGVLIGLGLILIAGDVFARTAATVLQAEEAREW